MAADHIDGEKSTFRCLDAARYVVATAVTVLIVTVIAYAVVLIFRPDSLTLVVDGGSVSVRRDSNYTKNGKSLGESLLFTFSVTATNPSGRSRLYFTNITGTFSGKNASGDYSFLEFSIKKDMVVAQQSAVTTNGLANSNRTMMDTSYFDSMNKNLTSNISTIIPDGMLQLNGNYTVELYGVHKISTHMIYYCRPLAIGDDPSEREESTDVPCTGTPPATLPIYT